MFGLFERLVAWRYLRARRREGFISVIAWFSLMGIALGVATLIIVMSVMGGFREELVGRILGIGGHISLYSATGGPIEAPEEIARRVRAVAGVELAVPVIETQALLTTGEHAAGVMVRGVTARDVRAQPIFQAGPGERPVFLRGGPVALARGEVMVGVRMAEVLGLSVGDEITLISPRFTPGAFGPMRREKTVAIGAVFELGMYEYDRNFIYMPRDLAAALFRIDGVSTIELSVADPDDMRAELAALNRSFGALASFQTWKQRNKSFVGALKTERNVMFLILTLLIVIAAFNIISGLIMLVKDKASAIAILRTMGAGRGAILRIFMLTGAAIGVLGTLAGLALGVTVTLNLRAIQHFLEGLLGARLFPADVYYLAELPAILDPAEVVGICAMALALSFLAALYPAWRAARLDPVEALRHG